MSHRFLPLAVGVLLLAAAPLRADDAEDQAAKAIEKLGGKVVRDDKDPDQPVIEVDFGRTKVTDAGLKEMAPLKGLQSLDLAGTQVTDAGLKQLADLKGLLKLNLRVCQGVTDAGLKELAPLKRLQSLDIGFTRVTDVGLKELANLKGLETLACSV